MLTDEQREVIKQQLAECSLPELLPHIELVIRGVASATDILSMIRIAYRTGWLKGQHPTVEAQNSILVRFPHTFK